MIEIGYLMKA